MRTTQRIACILVAALAVALHSCKAHVTHTSERNTPATGKHPSIGMPTENIDSVEREGSGSLMLILHSRLATFQRAEDLVVSFWLENKDEYYWAFLPAFAPERRSPENHPICELKFRISDSRGNHASYAGKYEGMRLTPVIESFLALQPRHFYGATISLSDGPFAYSFQRPGRYFITANLRFRQRAWFLMQTERLGLAPDALRINPQRVFDGELESNTLQITIQ